MVLTVLFLVFMVVTSVFLACALVLSVLCAISGFRGKARPQRLHRLKKACACLLAAVLLDAGLVALSQAAAYTPPIADENGNTPQNAIAELLPLKLNGRTQWVSIRGWDKTAPVLLFLAGGPGGTQLAAVRHELAELEKHFVVVGWDQPGSGKSFFAARTKDITLKTYIEDGYALTEYLRERFSQEKIYLVGESWGSALGIFLASRYPESYHAVIGTGQMVDFAETERIDYAKALEIAASRGDGAVRKRLVANGIPPYYGKDMVWKSALYLNYLSAHMSANPAIRNAGYNTLRDILSPEYGLLDKFTFLLGLATTFNHVYQQLYDIDLRRDYAELDVPVYLLLGRHDINAPTVLAEDYMRVLQAPEKELIWFEHSGHSPWINEPEKFVREVLACFSESNA
jgi:pimeloyl-ACP methyl ester carboxylesterase